MLFFLICVFCLIYYFIGCILLYIYIIIYSSFLLIIKNLWEIILVAIIIAENDIGNGLLVTLVVPS